MGCCLTLQAFRQLEAELNHEEALKQQLCDELNQVGLFSISLPLVLGHQCMVGRELWVAKLQL